MNRSPLIQSKFVVPEVPAKVLFSKRIRDFRMHSNRITIITAPAGFGKTTAVLLNLKKYREDIRWYRMEPEDSILYVFYCHLIETFFRGMDTSTLGCQLMLSSIHNLSEDFFLFNAQFCQDAEEYSCRQQRIFLVLDDFHYGVSNSSIIKSLRYFITNLPQQVSIIITSRIETGIISGKLCLRSDISILREDDLKFTEEEAKELVYHIYRSDLSENEAKLRFLTAEGWVAGLYLLFHKSPAFHLENNVGPIQENSDLERNPSLDREDLFRHFFAEFLSEVPPDTALLLSKLSILPDFSAKEISDIFEWECPDAFIKWLLTSNLYIQKINVIPARYRFHSLIKRELHLCLLEKLDKKALLGLYQKAASYHETQGNTQLAIHLYRIGRQQEKALSLAIDFCSYAFENGHTEHILPILHEFPEETVDQNAYLLFFRSMIFLNIDHQQSLADAEKSLLMFRKQNDMSYLMNSFGMILVIAYQLNDFRILKNSAKNLPKLKVLLAGGNPFKKLLISAAGNAVAREQLRLGLFLYQNPKKLQIADPIWDYSIWLIRGIALYRAGRFKESCDNITCVLRHPIALSSERWHITGLISCHLVTSLMRNISKAEELISDFSYLSEKYNCDFSRGFLYRTIGFVSYQTGNIEDAIDKMNFSAECFTRSNSPQLASISKITTILWQGELSGIENPDDAEEILSSLSIEDTGHGFYELAQCIVGAIYRRLGNYQKSEALLLASLKTSQKKGALHQRCSSLLQLFDLKCKEGDPTASVEYLRQWANLAAKNDYLYFWEMDYPVLIRACSFAYSKDLSVVHIQKIIEAYFGTENLRLFKENTQKYQQAPELLINEFFLRRNPGKNIDIKLLGKFTLTVDGKTITDKDFKTRKISGILKYILLKNGRAVSREILTEVFWPDSEPKSAFSSFRVALSELRKVLSNYDLGLGSETALFEEERDGFVLNSINKLSFDILKIDQLYSEYQASVSPIEHIALLEEIYSLCNGELLADNPYDEWVLVQREHYRGICCQVSHALSALYLEQGRYSEVEQLLKAQLLFNPYDEEACRLLLLLYEKTNQGSRRSTFKHQFEKRFLKEFGALPTSLD